MQRFSPDGHLNLNVRGLPQSATLAINERSAQLKEEGRKVYKFGLGQSPFPVPDVVQQALRDNAHQKDYLPVKGLKKLRQAVANYHSRTTGVDYEAEDVLIGPGSKELMFLLQLVYYGDLVIPTPSWVSYAPQAHIIGRPVRWLTTRQENGWRLQPEDLERLCLSDDSRPRIVILNYPSNPTGYTYSELELQEIADISRKYSIVLLSDEIYGEVHHDGNHKSIASYYPEGTIISSGLSKWCGAGGWRLGTFMFPKTLTKLMNAMAVAASETFTSTSAPIQYAAVTAFEGNPEIDEYLVHSRKILKAIGMEVVKLLREAKVAVGNPEGGFYVFPDFSNHAQNLKERGIETSTELCERLLEETGVATLPGSHFGRPESELTIRMAYVDFDGDVALKQSFYTETELGELFVKDLAPNVIEGVNALCDWLDY